MKQKSPPGHTLFGKGKDICLESQLSFLRFKPHP